MELSMGRKLLGLLFALAIAMAVGLLPGMGSTAHAATLNDPGQISASDVKNCSSTTELFNKLNGFEAVSAADAKGWKSKADSDTILIFGQQGDKVQFCWWDKDGLVTGSALTNNLNDIKSNIEPFSLPISETPLVGRFVVIDADGRAPSRT